MASKPGRLSDGMPQLSDARKARIDAFMPYVSVLPWFNVDVLHKLYLNVFKENHQDETTGTKEYTEYDLRTITCADFLQSPQVTRIDYNVFVIDVELRETLRNELKGARSIMKKLGEFMLAYADQCRDHFLSTRYVEVYRIEGNLIVNPAAEAGRIAQHVAQQLNNKRDLSKMEPSVAYFLNMLDQDDQTAGNEELKTFLKGMDSYLNKDKAEAAKEWEKLQGKENGGDSISIKLPAEVRKTILDNIKEARPQVQKSVGGRRLFAIIVGVDEYGGGVSQLNSCERDAQKLNDLLQDLASRQGAIEYHSLMLLSAEASRANVIEAFSHFKQARADRGDVCLFYFAGHGSQESASPGLKVDDKYSTLVCADSRTEGGFDLLDVEMSYLLWQATHEAHDKATAENELHTLVILDCSHSGGFTRGDTSNVSRQTAQPQATRALEYVLGYEEANKNEKVASLTTYTEALRKWQSIPKVSLASSKDQLAMEINVEGEPVGLFTWALLQEFRENGGAEQTYQDLVKRMRLRIRERNDKQEPVLGITGRSTENQQFLGGIFSQIDKAAPRPKIDVYLDQSTVPNMLLQALMRSKPDKASFDFGDQEESADYVVETVEDGFIISESASESLPIKVALGADELVENLGAIGRWHQLQTLDNSLSAIGKEDFELKIEVFEGNTEEDIENAKGEVFVNPDAIKLNYQRVGTEELAPFCKVRFMPFNGPYYVAAVFLGSRYDVVAITKVIRVAPREEISLVQLEDGGEVYSSLFIVIKDEYHEQGVTKITDYLKIVVSKEEFYVDDWLQEELPIERNRKASYSVRETELIDTETVFKDRQDWTTITVPITTTRPLPEKETVPPATWQPLSGHTAPVLCVAYSPDGRLALTGSAEGTAKLWEVESGNCVLSVEGFAGAINSIAFSPDGSSFVTGNDDNVAILWDTHAGASLETFTGHTGPVLSVAFSPDGRLLATGSEDRTHRLWSIEEGRLLQSVDHNTAVTCVAFSDDGKSVFTGSENAADESTSSQNMS